MNSLLEKLYAKEDLSFTETNLIFKDIFAGKLDPIVFGSLLTSLKMNVILQTKSAVQQQQ